MSGKRTIPDSVAIVIPSYMPDFRLIVLVEELIEAECKNIIIVNDGSPHECSEIYREIHSHTECLILRHEKNLGKGAALKTGIRFCMDNIENLSAVITVDGDGHHRIRDVVSCSHKTLDYNEVVLGQRNRDDATLYHKSRYVNRITSKLIDMTCHFDTKITDPLSSLRGLPAKYLELISATEGNGYDFETNMLLDFSRHSVPFRTFPIEGVFFENDEKTHHHPISETAIIIYKIVEYYNQQCRYLLSSLFCYSCEYIIYRLLLGYSPVPITLCNYIARIFSGSLNFTINKKIVFNNKKRLSSTALKYLGLQVALMIISTELIVILNSLFTDQSNLLAKFIKPPVDICMFFLSYYIQKKWVFKN